MITKYNYNGLVWVDVENPTKEDAHAIIEEYSIPHQAAKEILAPTLKPKVDLYENCICLVLHFPAFKHSHKNGSIQEVDFIIGKNFLITARYDTVDSLYNFAKIFETNSILNKEKFAPHAGFIFYSMIKEMYDALLDELSAIEDSMSEIEAEIFKGNEKKMVFRISEINRTILDFKRATTMHKEILSSLEHAGKDFFDEKFGYFLKGALNEYFKVASMLESDTDFLVELRETNNTLLQTKENETIKNFTILAFITFPLSLLVSILNLNKEFFPFDLNIYIFWGIFGFAVLIVLGIIGMFKYKI